MISPILISVLECVAKFSGSSIQLDECRIKISVPAECFDITYEILHYSKQGDGNYFLGTSNSYVANFFY